MWGTKIYYEKESYNYVNLNSTSDGLIINDKGNVECFIVGDEYKNGSVKWWGKKLEEYYPHPWFPDKEIASFIVVRILPNFELKQEYEVEEDGKIYSHNRKTSYTVEDCLEYPEFFEPIYKN